MVAAHPTRIQDLFSVQTHDWDHETDNGLSVVCRNCDFELIREFYLRDLPPCPGPDYILLKRSVGAHRKE